MGGSKSMKEEKVKVMLPLNSTIYDVVENR